MKKRIVLLSTGGTIAGSGEAGRCTGYRPGALSAGDLVHAVPQLDSVADIAIVPVCSCNSDDITAGIWLELAHQINTLAADPDTAGFVVTHGTDTLEETAYFLNLAVKTEKPVVVTGAMRPATALSADGPLNLYDAVWVAASEEAAGKGVLVVFAGSIIPARTAVKNHTASPVAIAADMTGPLGLVQDGRVRFYASPVRKHTTATEFDLSGCTDLPKVAVLYFTVDADSRLLAYAADHSHGIVVAGAGAGEFSMEYREFIEQCAVPVVISSRTGCGPVLQENMVCSTAVAADTLSPAKAKVLLQLALTRTAGKSELVRMFSTY